MSNYKMTIGCEIHTELKTKSKMFSSSANIYNSPINTNINEIDLALPGSMPSPNKQAVIFGIILAKAFCMKIESNLIFDRKNYFYQDLPKGFQITQQYFPIGKDGIVQITSKDIRIERIHLEEDTAKQISINDEILLDYNRAGIPLLEIVSCPDIHSKEECIEFLTELKRTLIFLGISDGKMEEGSLRVDLNISVSNTDALGTKVEIKNINSFSNVALAIDYEFDRQTKLLESGQIVNQETRRWDDVKKQTIFMRNKSNAIDYRYFCEPNIVNIDISDLIKQTLSNELVTHIKIKEQLICYGVNENIIKLLLDNYELYKIYKYVNDKINNISLTTTWIVIELTKLNNLNNKKPEDTSLVVLDYICEMLIMLNDGKINGKQAKQIFEKIYNESKNPNQIVKELNLVQITDENVIKSIIEKYIDLNKEMMNQCKDRPERIEKFLIGMLMKETSGQANPLVSKKVLDEVLLKYK